MEFKWQSDGATIEGIPKVRYSKNSKFTSRFTQKERVWCYLMPILIEKGPEYEI